MLAYDVHTYARVYFLSSVLRPKGADRMAQIITVCYFTTTTTTTTTTTGKNSEPLMHSIFPTSVNLQASMCIYVKCY